jgi:hypothetical protein
MRELGSVPNVAIWSLKPQPYSGQILGIGGEMPVVTIVVVSYLPQLLIAAVGGLLPRSAIRQNTDVQRVIFPADARRALGNSALSDVASDDSEV